MPDRLLMLGTGTLKPGPGRYGAGVLLEVRGRRLLLDCGPSAVQKLYNAGIDATELDAIFLSHFHVDHTSDLPDLISSLAADARGYPRRPESPVKLIGPPGLVRFLGALLESNPFYSYVAEWNRMLRLVEPVEVDEGSEVRLGELVLRFAPVDHPNGFAVRVDAGNISVVYSGDTAPTPSVVRLAAGSDFLVHECTFPSERLMGQHTSEQGLAEVASRSSPRALVVTHLSPAWSGREHELVDAVRASFRGRVVVARDMLEIPLT
ncbi:MAG: MBL fold metallo-hydrolase [Nitrososphaerota archaeon]